MISKLTSFIILLLTVITVISFCGSSVRAATPDEDSLRSQIADLKKAAQNNFTKLAQDKTVVGLKVYTGAKKIESRGYACLDAIRALFKLNAAISNPLAVVVSILLDQVAALVDQLCQMVTSAIQQIESSALSILNLACIPLPGLGLGGLDLHLPSIPCNGTNLLQPSVGRGAAPASPGRYPLWGF